MWTLQADCWVMWAELLVQARIYITHSKISHDLDFSVLPERSTVDGESIWHRQKTTCALPNLSQMWDPTLHCICAVSPLCYPNKRVGISDVNHRWDPLEEFWSLKQVTPTRTLSSCWLMYWTITMLERTSTWQCLRSIKKKFRDRKTSLSSSWFKCSSEVHMPNLPHGTSLAGTICGDFLPVMGDYSLSWEIPLFPSQDEDVSVVFGV